MNPFETELRDALHAESDAPTRPHAWDDVVRRGRRRQTTGRLGVAGGAVCVVALVAGLMALARPDRQSTGIVDDPSGLATPTSSASVAPRTAPAEVQFRLVTDHRATDDSCPRRTTNPPPGSPVRLESGDGHDCFGLGPAELVVRRVRDAELDQQPDGYGIGLTLYPADAETLAALTGRYVGEEVAIVVGGRVVSAPRIAQRVEGGYVQISGSFSQTEAEDLARALRGG